VPIEEYVHRLSIHHQIFHPIFIKRAPYFIKAPLYLEWGDDEAL